MNTHRLAAAIEGFGGPDTLRVHRLPRPSPKAGEIEVQVQAASVNPIDARRRAGYGRKVFSLMRAARMPLVLGNDFAGIVTAVGPGVFHFREGDAVFGAKPPSSAGTHATHVIVHAEHAALQLERIPAPILAALPYNYLTVSRALADAGLSSGNARAREVLVHGATGGLGLLAVRILKSWGAHVTAVGGSSGLDMCRKAGADFVIDRRRQPLRDLPPRFAATLNLANWNDETALLRLLAPDAIGHATTVHPMLDNLDSSGLLRGALTTMLQKKRMRAKLPKQARYAWTVFAPDAGALARLGDMAASLAPLVEWTGYPLAEAASAHSHVEQHGPGRAVLLPEHS